MGGLISLIESLGPPASAPAPIPTSGQAQAQARDVEADETSLAKRVWKYNESLKPALQKHYEHQSQWFRERVPREIDVRSRAALQWHKNQRPPVPFEFFIVTIGQYATADLVTPWRPDRLALAEALHAACPGGFALQFECNDDGDMYKAKFTFLLTT